MIRFGQATKLHRHERYDGYESDDVAVSVEKARGLDQRAIAEIRCQQCRAPLLAVFDGTNENRLLVVTTPQVKRSVERRNGGRLLSRADPSVKLFKRGIKVRASCTQHGRVAIWTDEISANLGMGLDVGSVKPWKGPLLSEDLGLAVHLLIARIRRPTEGVTTVLEFEDRLAEMIDPITFTFSRERRDELCRWAEWEGKNRLAQAFRLVSENSFFDFSDAALMVEEDRKRYSEVYDLIDQLPPVHQRLLTRLAHVSIALEATAWEVNLWLPPRVAQQCISEADTFRSAVRQGWGPIFHRIDQNLGQFAAEVGRIASAAPDAEFDSTREMLASRRQGWLENV